MKTVLLNSGALVLLVPPLQITYGGPKKCSDILCFLNMKLNQKTKIWSSHHFCTLDHFHFTAPHCSASVCRYEFVNAASERIWPHWFTLANSHDPPLCSVIQHICINALILLHVRGNFSFRLDDTCLLPGHLNFSFLQKQWTKCMKKKYTIP